MHKNFLQNIKHNLKNKHNFKVKKLHDKDTTARIIQTSEICVPLLLIILLYCVVDAKSHLKEMIRTCKDKK